MKLNFTKTLRLLAIAIVQICFAPLLHSQIVYSYDASGNPTNSVLNASAALSSSVSNSTQSVTLAENRVYDPDSGRWLSRDPIGEIGGLNLYKYAANNPISNVDPNGLCPQLGTVLGEGQYRDVKGDIRDESGDLIEDQLNPLNPINFEGANSPFNFDTSEGTIWLVGPHGGMPSPRPQGYQSHHGVNSVWMEANYTRYVAGNAPAVLMKNDPFHNATRGVFNRIRSEIAVRQGVSQRDIDWSQVSSGTAWRIAEEQFEAAQTPANIRAEYFSQFNKYLDSIR